MKSHTELSEDLHILRTATFPATRDGEKAEARAVYAALIEIQGHPRFRYAVAFEGSYREGSSAAQKRSAATLNAQLYGHAVKLAAVIRGAEPNFKRYDVLDDLGKAVAEIREVERRMQEGEIKSEALPTEGGAVESRVVMVEARLDAAGL